MWLPAPIYERMPLFWLLLGLLFIAYGLYLGLDISVAQGATVAGLICCLYGGGVRIVRIRHRRERAREENASEPATE